MFRKILTLSAPLLLLSALTVHAQDDTGRTTYTDPDGRYMIPVPDGWSATEQENYVEVSSPEGNVTVRALVLSLDETVEETIAAAWEIVLPDETRIPARVSGVPAPAGIEQRIAVNYETDGQLIQAVGSLVNGQVYVLLIDGNLVAAERRAAQVNTIVSGFTIMAVDEIDLSNAEPSVLEEAALADIEARIEDLRTRFQIPGAAVAIVQNGQVIYTGGFGVKSSDSDDLITPDTHMMIGSTGKSLTTTMMAEMVDAGLFGWDTPVAEVLPQFTFSTPQLTEQITMRNLVCACSGVPRRDLELFFNAEDLSAEGVVESLETFELFTDFGETFQYSNQMVAAGGYAAAAADGVEFGNLFDGYATSLEARVLSPLGMDNTTLSFEQVVQRNDYAQPHGLVFGSEQRTEADSAAGSPFVYRPFDLDLERILQPVAPAGAHWSTAEDMARYMLMQMDNGVTPDGQRLVSEENLAVTREGQITVDAETDYGLGWFVGDYEGIRLVQHGGNTQGFSSSFGFLPGKDLGVVVLTNGQNTNAFGTQVRNHVFDTAFDNVTPEQTEEEIAFALEQLTNFTEGPEGLTPNTPADVIQPYLGTYENEALSMVDILQQDGQVRMDAGLFTATLLWIPSEDDATTRFVLATPPLQGFPVVFTMTDGTPRMTIGRGTFEYTFTSAD